jgi:hypothetical protein
MTTIAGVKLGSLAKSKASLKSGSVGKLSPDPYSYEHRINLDQDAMAKAGMGETPKVGDVFHVMGEGHVHSVMDNGNGLNVGIQMRKLGVKKAPGGAKSKGPGSSGALGAVNQGIQDASS